MFFRNLLFICVAVSVVYGRLGDCRCVDDECLEIECNWSRWIVGVLLASFLPPVIIGLAFVCCVCIHLWSRVCCADVCGGKHPRHGIFCVKNRPATYTLAEIIFSKCLGLFAFLVILGGLIVLIVSTVNIAFGLYSIADSLDHVVDSVRDVVARLISLYEVVFQKVTEIPCQLGETALCTGCDTALATSIDSCSPVGPYTCPGLQCYSGMSPAEMRHVAIDTPAIYYPDSVMQFCSGGIKNAMCNITACASSCVSDTTKGAARLVKAAALDLYPVLYNANSSVAALRERTLDMYLDTANTAADAIRALTSILIAVVAVSVSGAALFTLCGVFVAFCNCRKYCPGLVMIAVAITAMTIWVIGALVLTLTHATGQICFEVSLIAMVSPSIVSTFASCNDLSFEADDIINSVTKFARDGLREVCQSVDLLCCAADYTFADVINGTVTLNSRAALPSAPGAAYALALAEALGSDAFDWAAFRNVTARGGLAGHFAVSPRDMAAELGTADAWPNASEGSAQGTALRGAGARAGTVTPTPGRARPFTAQCPACPASFNPSSLSDLAAYANTITSCRPLRCPSEPSCQSLGDVSKYVNAITINIGGSPCGGGGAACTLAQCAESCSNSVLRRVSSILHTTSVAMGALGEFVDPYLTREADYGTDISRPAIILCEAVLAVVASNFIGPCSDIHNALSPMYISLLVFGCGIIFTICFAGLGWKRWRRFSDAGKPFLDNGSIDIQPLWDSPYDDIPDVDATAGRVSCAIADVVPPPQAGFRLMGGGAHLPPPVTEGASIGSGSPSTMPMYGAGAVPTSAEGANATSDVFPRRSPYGSAPRMTPYSQTTSSPMPLVDIDSTGGPITGDVQEHAPWDRRGVGMYIPPDNAWVPPDYRLT